MEVKRADLLGEGWDFRFIADRCVVGLGCFVYEKRTWNSDLYMFDFSGQCISESPYSKALIFQWFGGFKYPAHK